MASFIVVFILMILLSLITIAYSQLMNRELRQATDRQLSAEAYYAAESGINDGRYYLAAGGGNSVHCPTPDPDSTNAFVSQGDISGDFNNRYTCVTTQNDPKELDYTIAAGQSRLIKLSGDELASMNKMFIGWENSSYNGGKQTLGTLPASPTSTGTLPKDDNTLSADATGLLRIGIYPIINTNCPASNKFYNASRNNNAISDTDADLECASRNYYLYPNSPTSIGNSIDFTDSNNDGTLIAGNCSDSSGPPPTTFASQATARYCNSQINNLFPMDTVPSTDHASTYFVRLTAVYKQLSISIQIGDGNSPSTALNIPQVQGIIDSTGAGNDVLHRIQARVPLQALNVYGTQSMESVCKLFRHPVRDPGLLDQAQQDNGGFNADGSCETPQGSDYITDNGLPGVPPDARPSAHIWAGSGTIYSGQSTTINWNTTDGPATSCTGTGFSTGNRIASAPSPPSTGPLSVGSHTYSITCNGPGGSDSDSMTVTVLGPPTCTVNTVGPGPAAWSATGSCTNATSTNWTWSFRDDEDSSGACFFTGSGTGPTFTVPGYGVGGRVGRVVATFTLTGTNPAGSSPPASKSGTAGNYGLCI